MSTTTYNLYVKTHNVTGLKYLGKTTRDPYKYRGSGTYWNNHLKLHGNNCKTEIIGSYSTIEELKEFGIYFSNLWNIVESEKWANLVTEDGYGGGPNRLGQRHSIEAKREMKLAWTKRNHVVSEDTKRRISETKTGTSRKPFTEEHKFNMAMAQQKRRSAATSQPFF